MVINERWQAASLVLNCNFLVCNVQSSVYSVKMFNFQWTRFNVKNVPPLELSWSLGKLWSMVRKISCRLWPPTLTWHSTQGVCVLYWSKHAPWNRYQGVYFDQYTLISVPCGMSQQKQVWKNICQNCNKFASYSLQLPLLLLWIMCDVLCRIQVAVMSDGWFGWQK